MLSDKNAVKSIIYMLLRLVWHFLVWEWIGKKRYYVDALNKKAADKILFAITRYAMPYSGYLPNFSLHPLGIGYAYTLQ